MSEVRGSGRECQAVTVQKQRSGAAKKSHPVSKVRGGPEESTRIRGRGGGLEEKPHARGQGRWQGGGTPCPRSRGCTGTGGPRGAIPCWKSGRVAVRRYPSSKVRNSDYALLEQP